MTDQTTAAARSAATLRAWRNALLPLHKALLDAERARYEQVHGRVESPHAVLRLVMSDPWFAWLRPLSALIVQIDERLDDDAPIEAAEVTALRKQMLNLSQPTDGSVFGDQYQRVLRSSPDVAVAHGHLAAVLREFAPPLVQ